MKSKKTSTIWKRTNYYFMAILGIFTACVIYFVFEISQERVENNILIQTTIQNSKNLNVFINKIQTAISAPNQVARVKEEIQNIKKQNEKLLQAAMQLQKLENKKRTSKNSKENLNQIEAHFNTLRNSFNHNEFVEESKKTHFKFIIVFIIFTFGICAVMLILIRMLLLPLEKIIQSAQEVAKGDLKASFKINSKDELGELATVLGDLTTNTSELLFLISNSHTDGNTQIKLLEKAIESENSEDQKKSIKEIKLLNQRLGEVTEYFQYKR